MRGEEVFALKRVIICPLCQFALEYHLNDEVPDGHFLMHPTNLCERTGDAYYLPKVRLQKMGPEVSRSSLCNGPCC